MPLKDFILLVSQRNEACPKLGNNKHHPNSEHIKYYEISEHGRNISIPNGIVIKIKLKIFNLKKRFESS